LNLLFCSIHQTPAGAMPSHEISSQHYTGFDLYLWTMLHSCMRHFMTIAKCRLARVIR
jgi:hypothetical protein